MLCVSPHCSSGKSHRVSYSHVAYSAHSIFRTIVRADLRPLARVPHPGSRLVTPWTLFLNERAPPVPVRVVHAAVPVLRREQRLTSGTFPEKHEPVRGHRFDSLLSTHRARDCRGQRDHHAALEDVFIGGSSADPAKDTAGSQQQQDRSNPHRELHRQASRSAFEFSQNLWRPECGKRFRKTRVEIPYSCLRNGASRSVQFRSDRLVSRSGRYRDTVRSETLMPSVSSLLWIRGAAQRPFSVAMAQFGSEVGHRCVVVRAAP